MASPSWFKTLTGFSLMIGAARVIKTDGGGEQVRTIAKNLHDATMRAMDLWGINFDQSSQYDPDVLEAFTKLKEFDSLTFNHNTTNKRMLISTMMAIHWEIYEHSGSNKPKAKALDDINTYLVKLHHYYNRPDRQCEADIKAGEAFDTWMKIMESSVRRNRQATTLPLSQSTRAFTTRSVKNANVIVSCRTPKE